MTRPLTGDPGDPSLIHALPAPHMGHAFRSPPEQPLVATSQSHLIRTIFFVSILSPAVRR